MGSPTKTNDKKLTHGQSPGQDFRLSKQETNAKPTEKKIQKTAVKQKKNLCAGAQAETKKGGLFNMGRRRAGTSFGEQSGSSFKKTRTTATNTSKSIRVKWKNTGKVPKDPRAGAERKRGAFLVAPTRQQGKKATDMGSFGADR